MSMAAIPQFTVQQLGGALGGTNGALSIFIFSALSLIPLAAGDQIYL